MEILSTWPGPGEDRDGLTFELSAFSPSDSSHSFKDFRLEQSYPYQEEEDLDQNFDAYKLRDDQHKLDGTLDDAEHGWTNGHCETTEFGSKRRLMGRLVFKVNDPSVSSRKSITVSIITGLLIRRQFHRKIPALLISGLIHKVCTSIRWFHHEGWYDVRSDRQVLYEEGMLCSKKKFPVHGLIPHIGTMFKTNITSLLILAYLRLLFKKPLPNTLREMRLFEDFNKTLHPERSTKATDRYLGRSKAGDLGHAATCLTKPLETFSASFFIDARSFFAHFHPGPETAPPTPQAHEPWENLRKLALTSCLLTGRAYRMIPNLLIAAGRAAALMPRLETMEIWNGGETHITIFRYTNLDGQRSLAWISNWLSPHLIPNMPHMANIWEQTLNLAPNTIKVEVSQIRQYRSVKTHVSAINLLKLRDMVLHPVSRYQLLWESGRTKFEVPEEMGKRLHIAGDRIDIA